MSGSAMCDAIVDNLSAASVFGSNMVGKYDYSVMERNSGSCAVIAFSDLHAAPTSFGAPRGFSRDWTFSVELFAKDTGDPAAAVKRLMTMVNTVLESLVSDDTLGGTSDGIVDITMDHPVGRAMSIGGATWLPVNAVIVARDLE